MEISVAAHSKFTLLVAEDERLFQGSKGTTDKAAMFGQEMAHDCHAKDVDHVNVTFIAHDTDVAHISFNDHHSFPLCLEHLLVRLQDATAVIGVPQPDYVVFMERDQPVFACVQKAGGRTLYN